MHSYRHLNTKSWRPCGTPQTAHGGQVGNGARSPWPSARPGNWCAPEGVFVDLTGRANASILTLQAQIWQRTHTLGTAGSSESRRIAWLSNAIENVD